MDFSHQKKNMAFFVYSCFPKKKKTSTDGFQDQLHWDFMDSHGISEGILMGESRKSSSHRWVKSKRVPLL